MPTEAPRFRGWLSEVRNLSAGTFPPFVTSRHGDAPDIGLPVFVYHTIKPASFEADLRFLSTNGYETLDADSFYAILTGQKEHRGTEVLLTIDDGRSSVWTHAYPLLKRHGHRAVVFAIPGCVPDRGLLARESGERKRSGQQEEAVGKRDLGLMSWEELKKAHRDSVLDIQSHTMFHRQVPVHSDVEDFVSPETDSPFYAVAVPLDIDVASPDSLRELAGLPIFRSEPLLSASVVYQELPEVLNAPRDLVQRHRGDDFFQQSDWRRTLLSTVQDARQLSRENGRYLEPSEVRDAILEDLTKAKAIIERRLEGKKVNHLCLPFAAGSELAIELAREAGYQSVFWGSRRDRPANTVGDDPFHCVRLKHDYVRRLPGRGRRSLFRILLGKVLRRLQGEAVY